MEVWTYGSPNIWRCEERDFPYGGSLLIIKYFSSSLIMVQIKMKNEKASTARNRSLLVYETQHTKKEGRR